MKKLLILLILSGLTVSAVTQSQDTEKAKRNIEILAMSQCLEWSIPNEIEVTNDKIELTYIENKNGAWNTSSVERKYHIYFVAISHFELKKRGKRYEVYIVTDADYKKKFYYKKEDQAIKMYNAIQLMIDNSK